MASSRDVVFPPGRQALYERNHYSPAVRSNGFLFVSGQIGSREDGSPEPELEAQVRRAFDNLNAILKAAGCTFDDVVDVTVFIVDPESNFETIWKLVATFPATHTKRAFVGTLLKKCCNFALACSRFSGSPRQAFRRHAIHFT